MKEIKQYLRNQKDVYTMLYVEELKSDKSNLAQAHVWLTKMIIISEELEQLEKN